MIRFDSIRVSNFALYTDVTLSFSLAGDRPLTLLRGENESGKTTLMRAFLWALFGKDALPRIPDARHPVRPVWAKPGETIRTRVEVRFRSESERGVTHQFRLSRSVDTADDGTSVTSGPEKVSLFRRDGNNWVEQDDELQILLKRFFRPEMRDFYFIDADKAVEFVGGPEGRHSDEMMRATITNSLRALLGLDAMLKAQERLEERQNHFARTAGSQSSDLNQQKLANELEEKTRAHEAAKARLSELTAEEKEREQLFKSAESDLDERLSKLAEIDETNKQYEEVTRNLADAQLRQRELLNELGQRLDDERLYAALMLPVIDGVMGKLQPLKDKGYIPPSELTLLPRLLEHQECVCGTKLLPGCKERKHIEHQIESAQALRGRTQVLDAALEAARLLGNRAIGRSEVSWKEETESVYKQLADLDPRISQLTEQQDALKEAREKAGTGTALRELTKHRDELRAMFEAVREQRKAKETEVDELHKAVRSLSERIRTAATAEKRTQHARSCAEIADHLRQITAAAYDAIEREQVVDVSRSMNSLFSSVISATSESLFGEVGIRPVPGERLSKQYELYTKESGREKPLALANGASRRAIGVAFVLALAEETRTKVPLVADSLLHAMSGTVRRKIVDYLTKGDRVGQPVLFGTRADFLDRDVLDLLKGRAGKTYTLTAQAHAGGDVVRATSTAKSPKQVVVCDCGVDQFCSACERAGDQTRAAEGRLTSRTASEVLT